MKAEDVMTRAVITIDPDATVLQAARLMLQHHISGLPVVDKDGKLVGVLSEGDFLRRRETKTEQQALALARIPHGPGPHGGRIYPFARQQGVRGDDHRRAERSRRSRRWKTSSR